MREKVKNSAIRKCCKTLIMDFYLDNSSCEKTKKWLYSLLCSFIFLSVYIFVYTVDKFEWPILTIVLLGILIFCSGIVIVHIIWLDERPASITIRLLRDLVVGVVFITLFYSMGFKFSASEGLQVYLGHVSVFIIGFLFGELIFGYFEIARLNREIIDSIKTVNITTEKITAKIGNELIEYQLKKFLPGLQYTGVFSGHHNIGIFKIETVSFVNYSDMATNLLK